MLDETREGLEQGAAGAGGQSAGTQQVQTPAAQTPPAAAAADTTATGADQQAQDNLDNDPRFQKHKSIMDQKLAEATRQAEEARQQAEEAQRRLDERQQAEFQAEQERVMRQGTPQEIATYWQGRAQMMEDQIQTQQQRQQYVETMTNRATAMLQKLGLDWNTPGLDKDGGVSPDGFARLAESAAEIAAKQRAAEQTVATGAVEEAARQGHLQGLKEAGVTGATLGAGRESGSIADITDPTELLGMAMKSASKARAAKRGS